eukprot:3093083-Amphidinium_carterae.1
MCEQLQFRLPLQLVLWFCQQLRFYFLDVCRWGKVSALAERNTANGLASPQDPVQESVADSNPHVEHLFVLEMALSHDVGCWMLVFGLSQVWQLDEGICTKCTHTQPPTSHMAFRPWKYEFHDPVQDGIYEVPSPSHVSLVSWPKTLALKTSRASAECHLTA